MLQPQSDEEIRPTVEALKRLDALLDVQWNPKARVVTPGRYDATAGKRHAPVYDGRWQVIRHDTPGLTDRGYVVICEVTAWERVGDRGIIMMDHKGAYAPIGDWLVEHMQQFDAAQRKFAAVMDEVWKQHEQAESNEHVATRDAHVEAAERVYATAAGPYWMGRGADLENTPTFGKGKKTPTAGALEPL